MTIHADNSKATYEAMLAEMIRLRIENEALKAGKPNGLKISPKGAVCLYGMGKWPVTLYKQQWLKVLGMADEIKAFIKANDDKLSQGK